MAAILASIKKHRSIILLALSLALFACHGLLEEANARSAWIDCISTLFVLMLFLSIAYDGMSYSVLGTVVACIAFSMIWLDNVFPLYAATFRQFEDLSLLMLIGTFVVNSIRTLIRKDLIGSEHLSASFALYLLLGIWWGFLYDFIWVTDPFDFVAGQATHYTLGDFFQFSLSTMTTVMTSPIVAHTQLIRCFSTIEAVCGQFYFAMLIGGLVGAHFSDRRRGLETKVIAAANHDRRLSPLSKADHWQVNNFSGPAI